MTTSLPEKWESGVVHNIKDAIHAHRGLYGHRMKSMRDAFNAIDRDHDRSISPDEFAEAMHRLDIGMTKPQLREMVELADVDGDGGIDYNEFCRLLGVRRLSAMLDRKASRPSPPIAPPREKKRSTEKRRRLRRTEGHHSSPASVKLPSPIISPSFPPSNIAIQKNTETSVLNLLIRQHFENTMLLRTLRNVVAEDLESDQFDILDKVLKVANEDCLQMQNGTFGSTLEDFASQLESRQKQQLSKHLKSIELHVAKARAERHFRLKGILANEVERASRAREDMNRYRLELKRVKSTTPSSLHKLTPPPPPLSSTSSNRRRNKEEQSDLAIVPTLSSPTRPSQARTVPPTQINVHLPPDWDGRSIEIFMSEDEYEDDDDDDDDDELPPVPTNRNLTDF